MIPLHQVEFESKNPDKDWEKLKWAIQKDETFFDFKFLEYSSIFLESRNTSREWIGEVDKEERTFKITSARNLWIPKMFQIIVKGRFKGPNELHVSFEATLTDNSLTASFFLIPSSSCDNAVARFFMA